MVMKTIYQKEAHRTEKNVMAEYGIGYFSDFEIYFV